MRLGWGHGSWNLDLEFNRKLIEQAREGTGGRASFSFIVCEGWILGFPQLQCCYGRWWSRVGSLRGWRSSGLPTKQWSDLYKLYAGPYILTASNSTARWHCAMEMPTLPLLPGCIASFQTAFELSTCRFFAGTSHSWLQSPRTTACTQNQVTLEPRRTGKSSYKRNIQTIIVFLALECSCSFCEKKTSKLSYPC